MHASQHHQENNMPRKPHFTHCRVYLALTIALTLAQLPAKLGLGQPATDDTRRPLPAHRDFSWRETEASLALMNHGRMVWQHVHDRKIGKPYMRIGLIDGTELTRPCPFPKGYPKSDHTWHRALWWSWKAINGINFWEKNQPGTDPTEVEITHHDDGSAQIDLTIAYHLPDEPPLVVEKRVITVSAPDKSGAYHINWQATFTPGGKDDVVFNRNSYGGMALRMAAECCGDPAAGKQPWSFLDSEGRANCNNQTARWVNYSGTAPNGRPASVAMFDHPDNPRHPSWWQSRSRYPYLNPSFTCKEDYTLPAGRSLTLRYRILVHQGAVDTERLEQAWNAFSAPLPAPAAQRHNEKALKQKYDSFVESLDVERISHDYPKAVQNLDSLDSKTQLAGIKTLGATGEVEVLPWLVPFVDSKEHVVRIYAGLSIFQAVTSHELKRRDMSQPGKVVIKPPGPNDIDLRPVAWVILKMFRTSDPNMRSYAANMVGYLSLCEFEGELREMLKSRHPSETRAARSAMHMAGIDLADEPRPSSR